MLTELITNKTELHLTLLEVIYYLNNKFGLHSIGSRHINLKQKTITLYHILFFQTFTSLCRYVQSKKICISMHTITIQKKHFRNRNIALHLKKEYLVRVTHL